MRLQLTVPDEIGKKLDKYCADNSDTRSGVVANLLNSYFKQIETIDLLQRIVELMEQIAVTNEMTKEQENQLKHLKSILSRITSSN